MTRVQLQAYGVTYMGTMHINSPPTAMQGTRHRASGTRHCGSPEPDGLCTVSPDRFSGVSWSHVDPLRTGIWCLGITEKPYRQMGCVSILPSPMTPYSGTGAVPGSTRTRTRLCCTHCKGIMYGRADFTRSSRHYSGPYSNTGNRCSSRA